MPWCEADHDVFHEQSAITELAPKHTVPACIIQLFAACHICMDQRLLSMQVLNTYRAAALVSTRLIHKGICQRPQLWNEIFCACMLTGNNHVFQRFSCAAEGRETSFLVVQVCLQMKTLRPNEARKRRIWPRPSYCFFSPGEQQTATLWSRVEINWSLHAWVSSPSQIKHCVALMATLVCEILTLHLNHGNPGG